MGRGRGGAGGAPGAVRGEGVSKSATKAPRAGIGRERKRRISTILLARPGSIRAFATDLDNEAPPDAPGEGPGPPREWGLGRRRCVRRLVHVRQGVRLGVRHRRDQKGGSRVPFTPHSTVARSKSGGMTPFVERPDPPHAPKSMREPPFRTKGPAPRNGEPARGPTARRRPTAPPEVAAPPATAGASIVEGQSGLKLLQRLGYEDLLLSLGPDAEPGGQIGDGGQRRSTTVLRRQGSVRRRRRGRLDLLR